MVGSRRRGDTQREAEPPDPAVLGLAREIRAEVDHISESGGDAQALVDAVQAVPRRERLKAAREVFDRLPVEQQWQVLVQVFDDAELRIALESARDEMVGSARRRETVRRLARDEGDGTIDLGAVEPGLSVRLGLFTERDVAAAVERGQASSSCARRLDLVSVKGAYLRVLSDVFNPAGGYFVTRSYDENTWRADQLEAHSLVRVGSISGADRVFSPVVYARGRLDFEVEGRAVVGPLHLGYAVIEGIDLFGKGGASTWR